jgi:AcrR family transcriptional regulator
VATSKGEQTRHALLDAAIQRFAADGYQRTSVTDIARDVGLTPAAVYAYFPGKEALFLAAVDADATGLVDLAARVLTAGGEQSLVALLTGLARDLVAAVHQHPLVARVLGGAEQLPIAQAMALESLQGLRTEIASYLRLGQDIGLVRDGIDPSAIALGLESIVVLWLPALVQAGDSLASDERWLAIVAVIEAALKP